MKRLLLVLCLGLFAAIALARGPVEIKAEIAQIKAAVLTAKSTGAETKVMKQRLVALHAELRARDTRQTANRLDAGGETCDDATVISSLPYFDDGVIDGSTGDDYTSDTLDFYCGSNGAEVVYKLIIDGDQFEADYYTVSTCGSWFDTVLELWYGCPGSEGSHMVDCDDDANESCEDENDGYSSCISDLYLENGTYYIFVSGYSFDEGFYELLVTTGDDCNGGLAGECAAVANNSWCEGAEPLTLVDSEAYVSAHSGTGAMPEELDECYNEIEACGLWYTITGTGYLMQAHTCNEATDYDTKLFVYDGNCGELECVTSNDDWQDESGDYVCASYDYASGVEWCTVEGVTYYIFVSGYDGETGDFGLTVRDLDEVCEPPCREQDYYFTLDEVPFCQCLTICENQIQKIFVGPAGPNDYPVATWNYGCFVDDRTQIPPSGCNEDCYPAYPELYMDWIYLPELQLWCMDLYSYYGGCYCFCIDRILPVELNDFAAVAGHNQVTINWSTASESEADRFEIERDGQTVASVHAENSATGATYSWADNDVNNGTNYSYSLVLVNLDGSRDNLATEQVTPNAASGVVSEFALYQNYPNPFNPETNISFDLVEAGKVTLKVFNVTGQELATLAQGTFSAGRHTVRFDGSGLASGVYLYRLETDGQIAQHKMVLLK